ncbi:MAG: glycosyltransferase [Actinomycetota bacterium]|nr:glycosyltransferase [Actinomycetota bacterium]
MTSGGRQLRVLCTSTGGAGHINALAPVAVALRGRGHVVQWAVAADGGERVAAMGFEWSLAGMTTSDRRDAAADQLGRIMQLPMADRRGPMFAAFFARAAAPVMQRDLAPILERVRPDLVVREVAELGVAPMAAARSIPVVTVAFSGVLPENARAEVMADLGPLWHVEGFEDPSWDDVHGQIYVHPFPPSFGQRPDSSAVRPARATGAPTPGTPPDWVHDLGATRPCVYVTSGTERTAMTFPWRDVFAVIAGLDVDAVATIGSHVDLVDLGPVPPNVRVERFVPQVDVLQRTAVAISHGGAGTVLGAASHGVPQLVVPLFADQWQNAVAVRDAGCGVLAGPDARSAGDIDASLRSLLGGAAHRDAAAVVANEIAAMPTATDLVDEIESLVER